LKECLDGIQDLEIKLLKNNSDIGFITSDNPIVFYNQLLEEIKFEGAKTGIIHRGLIILLPLSPLYCIILYDSKVYKIGSKKQTIVNVDYSDINNINALTFLSSDKIIYLILRNM